MLKTVRARTAPAAIGLLASLALWSPAAAAPAKDWSEMSQAEAEQAFDAAVVGSETVIAEIRALLPKDYARIARRTAAMLRIETDEDLLFLKTRQEIEDVVVRHHEDLAAAPTAELMLLIRAEANYVHALQASGPGRCADHLEQARRIDPPSGDAVDQARDAMNLADVRAIKAGIDAPQARPTASDQDLQAWVMALTEHEGPKLAAHYLDPALVRKGAQRERCEALVAFFDAFVALPPEAAARVFLNTGMMQVSKPDPSAPTEPTTEDEARRLVQDWADEGPADTNLDAQLKSLLPQDYGAYVEKITPVVLAGLDEDGFDERRYAVFEDTILDHLDQIKAAPDADLLIWARTKAEYNHALQANGAEVCAAYLSGVGDLAGEVKISDRVTAAFSRSYVARWRLIRAGMDHPTSRPDLTEADRQVREAALAKRLGAKRTAERRLPAWRRSANHRAVCDADVATFDTTLDLPIEAAAPLLALAAAGVDDGEAGPYAGLSQANAERAIDAEVAAGGSDDGWLKALKAELPSDYQLYLQDLAAVARKGASIEQLQSAAEASVHEIFDRHTADFVAAPSELAADFFAKQLAAMRTLQTEDVARCAGMFFGASGTPRPISARSQAAIELALSARLKAIRAGIDHPVARAAASDDELQRWEAAFAAAIPTKLQMRYLEDTQMTDASDQDRCAVSIAVFEAIAAQREDAAARIFRTIVLDQAPAPAEVASVAAAAEVRF